MSVGDDFLEYVRELLAELGPLRAKRMFGAVGLYAGEAFFAVADDDVLYLKADAETQPLFEAAGSRVMSYAKKDGTVMDLGYWSLPDAAADEPEEAVRWARLALEAARRKAVRTRPKRAPSRP